MSNKMPNTPFSTRLSGSAKETELRLCSIFQWKKKRPPVVVLVLAAVVVLLCFGLVSCVTEEPPQEEMPAVQTPPTEQPAASIEPPQTSPLPGESEFEIDSSLLFDSYVTDFPFYVYTGMKLSDHDGHVFTIEDTPKNLAEAAVIGWYCLNWTGGTKKLDLYCGNEALKFGSESDYKRYTIHEVSTLTPEDFTMETMPFLEDLFGWLNKDIQKFGLTEYTVVYADQSWEWTPEQLALGPQLGNGRYERLYLLGKTESSNTWKLYECYWGEYVFGRVIEEPGLTKEPEPVPTVVPTPEPTPVPTPEPTSEPSPEPDPAGPQSSDPGWVLLTFADGTYREGWSSHDDVDTEAAAKGGTRLIFHVKEEELEWASSVEPQKATVRFGASEWEHPGELYYNKDLKALEFTPIHDDSRAYFYYKQLVRVFAEQSERYANRQFVLDYVDAMFEEGKTELWAFLFPGTGPIAASVDEYRYEVRSVFMDYEWTLETGKEPDRKWSHDDWTMYLISDSMRIAENTNSNWVNFARPGQESVYYSYDGEPGSLSNALLDLFYGPAFKLARVYIPSEGQDNETLMKTYEAKFREQYLVSSGITDYQLRELSLITAPDGADSGPFFLFSFSVKPTLPNWGDWKNYAVKDDGWVDFSFEISLSQGGYEDDVVWMCGFWQLPNNKD